jgi:hypothetical protein
MFFRNGDAPASACGGKYILHCSLMPTKLQVQYLHVVAVLLIEVRTIKGALKLLGKQKILRMR